MVNWKAYAKGTVLEETGFWEYVLEHVWLKYCGIGEFIIVFFLLVKLKQKVLQYLFQQHCTLCMYICTCFHVDHK